MITLRKKSLSSPDLTRLRGRSPFGVAKVRRSIALHKIRFSLMDARVIHAKTRFALLPAHDGVCAS
jgi:hypothetical protein